MGDGDDLSNSYGMGVVRRNSYGMGDGDLSNSYGMGDGGLT